MKAKHRLLKAGIGLLQLIVVTMSYAGNKNPASIDYVDEAVANAIALAKQPTYKVGDRLQGGTIFYLDATKRHGLMVLTQDLSNQAAAGFSFGTVAQGQGLANGIGGGLINSQYWYSLVQSASPGSDISDIASGFTLNVSVDENSNNCPNDGVTKCFSGWYLPSAAELQMLYSSGFVTINCAGPTTAWSSTSNSPYPNTTVFVVDFTTGVMSTAAIAGGGLRCVLPIRQF